MDDLGVPYRAAGHFICLAPWQSTSTNHSSISLAQVTFPCSYYAAAYSDTTPLLLVVVTATVGHSLCCELGDYLSTPSESLPISATITFRAAMSHKRGSAQHDILQVIYTC